jgi:hypothetical protein
MDEALQLREFIKKRPYFIWYTGNYDALSAPSIIEATLNYGDWEDVQELIGIMGIHQVADIFRAKSALSGADRQNYFPEVKHYFTLYFNKYA